MQTFLPYPSFADSARVLDSRRLGKQRVEAYQILRTLSGVSRGWAHHPAVRMWAGHSFSLACYGATICAEWRRRGYRDSMLAWFYDLESFLGRGAMLEAVVRPHPPWLGDPAFHASHRSNLLRKDPAHYGQFGWTEPPDLPYVWPVPKSRAEDESAQPLGPQ